ncbi:MAG: hypothetical protein AAF891_10435 [Pseudomonadota bacterium]
MISGKLAPTIGDILVLARALHVVPPRWRRALCRALLNRALRARSCVRTSGHAHPICGDGTISSAVLRRGRPHAPLRMTHAYAASLIVVLQMLYPEAQDTQR